MDLIVHRFDLPLRHRFTISRGSTDVSRTVIVELCHGETSGYGEAGENSYYGATLENIAAALDAVRDELKTAPPDDPAGLWEALSEKLSGNSFAQCALDLAAHDLWGKLAGAPVWKLWGLSMDERRPRSNYTIGIDTIERMVAKMEEFAGWPVYKVKLGTPEDIDIVRQLRRHTDATFRVDANCAWTADEAIRNAPVLKELGVEFIEQPLEPDDWAGHEEVFRRSILPVVADESCRWPDDVARCGGCFHGVNVKLVKCGGLTPARRMLVEARSLGLKTMVGCMTESTVGVSAIAQLLPLLDYVDMDGALLLAEDCATGVTLDHGRAVFGQENGCGVRLLRRNPA